MSMIPGINGLPKFSIRCADGARAEGYLHGAHLTSWKAADGMERLFLSPRSEFKAGAAIRGGVPVIFPQFSGIGPLPKHGFARNRAWELVEAGEGSALLRLKGDAGTGEAWPHAFACEMRYRIEGKRLEMNLNVTNTGERKFEFHAALHGYFAVGSLSVAKVTGLGGLRWRNNPSSSDHGDSDEVIGFGTEVDRIFYEAGERTVELEDDRGRLRFTQTGFADSVIWNPGPEVGARIGDLEPKGYLNYVCVEAAKIQPPACLGPGESWSGVQRVEVV